MVSSLDTLLQTESNAFIPHGIEVDIEGTHNFRDAGKAAYFVADKLSFGKDMHQSSIRTNRLFRSANLSNLTVKGEEDIINLGIKTVIDLRSESEVKSFGRDNFSDVSNEMIEYCHFPMNIEIEDEATDDLKLNVDDQLELGYRSMRNLYSKFVTDKDTRQMIGKVIAKIASSPPCLIHCRSGKDRTGWIVALCHWICKTDDLVVLDEYLMSKAWGIEKAKELANMYSDIYKETDWRFFIPYSSVFDQYLLKTYDLLIDLFGSFDQYLSECGITKELVAQLQNKLCSSSALTVLAGPTAVGKGTVSRKLLEKYPEIYLSISATTRPLRDGEVNHLHYHFISDEEFDQKIENDEFLEWAVVHEKYKYGTLKQPIEEALKSNRPALLEIDLQGARNIKKVYSNAKFVFLAPPSFEELITRLGMRGTESQEERLRRLDTAREEMKAQNEFDHIVVNDNIDEAVKQLASIVI